MGGVKLGAGGGGEDAGLFGGGGGGGGGQIQFYFGGCFFVRRGVVSHYMPCFYSTIFVKLLVQKEFFHQWNISNESKLTC